MFDEATAVSQLSAIRAMIADTRRSATDHWTYLMIWGGLGVVAAAVSHLLLGGPHAAAIWLVWSAYWVVGSVLSNRFGRRAERRTGTRTFIGRILGATWNAGGVTIGLVWLAVLTGTLPVACMPAMILWVAAGGLCVMAAALEFPALFAAAGLWWIGGVYTLFRPQQTFLAFAVLVVVGFLAPAALLRRRVAADDAID